VFYLLIFNYFCIMKKISLKGVQETLSDWELKNVKGGGFYYPMVMPDDMEVTGESSDGNCDTLPACGDTPEKQYCAGKKCGDSCTANGRNGRCIAWPNGANYYCKVCWLG
jgi:hypothetical protein